MANRFFICCCFLIALAATAAVGVRNCWAQNSGAQIHGFQVALPKGTIIPVVMEETVSTETAFVGQEVRAAILQDIYVGTHKVLSRQDQVFGEVDQVQAPIQGRNALLTIRFTHLLTQFGEQVDLTCHSDTGNDHPYWGGETTPGTKPVVIPYNIEGIGTYGRVMYHGKRALGQNLILYPGTRVVVILDAPIKLLAL